MLGEELKVTNYTPYHKTSQATLPVHRVSKCVNSLEDSHSMLWPNGSRWETCALYAIATRYHIKYRFANLFKNIFGYNVDRRASIGRKTLGQARRSHHLYNTKIKGMHSCSLSLLFLQSIHLPGTTILSVAPEPLEGPHRSW